MDVNLEQLEQFNALTPLQRDIAHGVLAGLKGTQAYQNSRHGKAKKAATIAAAVSEILKKPKVKMFLDSMRAEAVADIGLDTAMLVKQFMIESQMIPGQADVTPSSRVAALKELTNYTGGFDKNKQDVDLTTRFGVMSNEELLRFIKGDA